MSYQYLKRRRGEWSYSAKWQYTTDTLLVLDSIYYVSKYLKKYSALEYETDAVRCLSKK